MYVMKQNGWIEVICGSMFSGKSEELIRRVRRALFAKQKIAVFKAKIDNRYSEEAVVSHNGTSFSATPISHSTEIFQHIDSDVDVIAIDVLFSKCLLLFNRVQSIENTAINDVKDSVQKIKMYTIFLYGKIY